MSESVSTSVSFIFFWALLLVFALLYYYVFVLFYFTISPLMPVCFLMRDRMRMDQDGRGERRKWEM